MANTEGQFNYDIVVDDRFSAPLERFREALIAADSAFEDLQRTAAKGIPNGGGVGGRGSGGARGSGKGNGNDALSQLKDLEKIQENIRKAEKRSADEARRAQADRDRKLKADAKAIKEFDKLLEENEKADERRKKAAARRELQEQRARDRKLKADAKGIKDFEKLLDANEKKAERARKAVDKRLQAEAKGLKDFQKLLEANEKAAERAFRASPAGQAQSTIEGAQRRSIIKDLLAQQGFNEDGTKQLGAIDQALEFLGQSAKSVAESISGLVVAFLSFRALQLVGDVIAATGQAFVDFNTRIEDATLGIASLLTAVGDVRDITGATVPAAERLTLAQGEATRQVQQLRKEALLTAATFDELSEAFQTAVAPGLNAGLDIDQVRQFSVAISQAATSLGVASNQLSEEIRSILGGTITARTTRIATALGISNEDINKAKQQGTLADFLAKRFEAFNISAQAGAKTFTVILSNLRDAFDQAVGGSGEVLFDEIKLLLRDVNNFLVQRDKDGLVIINPEIKDTLEAVAEILKEVVSIVRQIDIDTQGLGTQFKLVANQVKVAGDNIRAVDAAIVNMVNSSIRMTVIFAALTGQTEILRKATETVSSILSQGSSTSGKKSGPGAIIADLGEQTEKTLEKIEEIRDEVNKVSFSATGKDSLFSGATIAATEFREILSATAREEKEARDTLSGLVNRAIRERFQEARTLGLVKVGNERVTNAVKNRLVLEQQIAALVRARQVAEIRSSNEQGADSLVKARADTLRLLGKEDEAVKELRAERERAGNEEIKALRVLQTKVKTAEELSAILIRISQIQGTLASEANQEDLTAANKAKKEAEEQAKEVAEKAAEAEKKSLEQTREYLRDAISLREKFKQVSLEADEARVSALEDQASRIQELGLDPGIGLAAFRARVDLIRQEGEERKRILEAETQSLIFEAESLGMSQDFASSLTIQKEKLDQITQLRIEALTAERAQTPERFGGTQTGAEETIQALDIDVLGAAIGQAQSMVQAFGQFTADTIFAAFNPDENILNGLSNLLENLGKQILSLIAQIIIAKLVILAIETAISAVSGGTGAAVGAGVSAVGGIVGAVAGGDARGGRIVNKGRYQPSFAHGHAPGFAFGGRPSGLAASDTVPAWLTPGEWVMRLSSVRKYGEETMARINAGMVDPMALREVADRAPRVAPTMPSGLGRATGGPAPIASVSGARPGPIQAFMVSSEEATKISKEGGEAAEFRWLRKNRAKARLALGFRP